MTARTTAIAAVALAAGAAIGAVGGYYYARHRFVAAVEQLTAAISTPDAGAAAPVAGPPAAASAQKTDWRLSSNTDPISGRTSWFVAGISHETDTVLYVRCGLAPGAFTTFVYGEQLYPGAGVDGDTFYVDYRFDRKPGVSMQRWDGSPHSASPYTTNGDEQAFLNGMAHSQSLIMRVGSTVMDSGTSSIGYQHFDLAGYNEAAAKLRPHCTGVTPHYAQPSK